MAAWVFLRTSTLVTWFLYEIPVTFVSIPSQRPLSFSLALQSRSLTHSQVYKNVDMTKERISSTFDPRDMLLCQSCSGMCNLWESLRFWAVIWNNCSKVLEACHCSKLLSFNLDLLLDGCHWRCLSLVLSFQHLSPFYTLCRSCRDYQLGPLVVALLQQDHQWHRQTADW